MEKIILCRIAWMKYYEGRSHIDIPQSGSKYIQEHKTGHEIWNFLNVNGKSYGHFPNIISANIDNLGAAPDDSYIDGVTVVFCARHPKLGGIKVVGWYKNTRVYRNYVIRSGNKEYHAVASYNLMDVKRIEDDDRWFDVSGTFGRSSLYYIGMHKRKYQLLKRLINYIESGGKIPGVKNKLNKRKQNNSINYPRWQQDVEKRKKVEIKAMKLAELFYADRYGRKNVKLVPLENKGWDIEVKIDHFTLKVEVKGLSGPDLIVELTPNEFNVFSRNLEDYHLFVVTNALNKPVCRVFKYNSKSRIWVANDKSVLNKPQKIVGARLSLCD